MLSATGARASLASVVVGKLVARFSGAEAGDWKRSLLLLRREGGRRQVEASTRQPIGGRRQVSEGKNK